MASTSFSIESILGKRTSSDDKGPASKRIRHSVESLLNPAPANILHSVASIINSPSIHHSNILHPSGSGIRHSIENILQEPILQIGGAAKYILIKRSVQKHPSFELIKKKLLFHFHIKKMLNPIEEMTDILNDFILKEILQNCFKISFRIRNTKTNFDINFPYETPKADYKKDILKKFSNLEQSNNFTNFCDENIELIMNQVLKKKGSGRMDDLLNATNINKRTLLNVKMEDNKCLFHACIAAKKFMTGSPSEKRNLTRKLQCDTELKKAFWQDEAEKLMLAIGAPLNDENYAVEEYGSKIIDHFNNEGEETFRLGVFDAANVHKPYYKYGSSKAKNCLFLLFFNNHFTAVKNIAHVILMDSLPRHYCLDCEIAFNNIDRHSNKCVNKCQNCLNWGISWPCLPDGSPNAVCKLCNKNFWNKKCMEIHLKKKACLKYKKCDDCGVTYRVRKKKHVCEQRFCYNCRDFHEVRECYITKLEKKEIEAHRIITFDFECSQDTPTNVEGVFEHMVNCIVARVTCTECLDDTSKIDCKICGPDKLKIWNAAKEPDILQKFMQWMFFDLNPEYKSISLAHFGGRYDFPLLMADLYNRPGLKIQTIRNGNKFYQINVSGGKKVVKTVFKDTYNFFMCSLENLVPTFNLDVTPKPFFPHYYNRESNFHICLPHLPPPEDYGFISMMPKKKEAFLKFYEENYHTEFLLSEELEKYCQVDVEILQAAVLKYRQAFLEITGVDAFFSSATIAGLCQKHFRQNHIKSMEHVIIPENGFEIRDKASKEANVYFAWLNKTENRNILFSENGGEQSVLRYKVDGKEGRTCYEYDGCWHHGCSTCYLPETLTRSGMTNEKTMMLTEERKNKIRAEGFEVVTIKSCEVKEMRKNNKVMDTFFKKKLIGGPINFREAFTGGRTHPMALHAVSSEAIEIVYRDVISLYPHVNFSTAYPLGFPKIHKFCNEKVSWKRPEDNPYKGLIKCFVLPPQNIKLPVLPHRVKNRLLFPLCAACGDFYKGKNTRMQKYECPHPPEQRGFITTVTHMELEIALQHGYEVQELYRVYEFTEFSDDVFKSYVREFLKLKVESSGWPPELTTDQLKEEYILAYKTLFGVDIDPSNVKFNPGMRFIAKICLNSLWGRFAMRNNLSATIITQSAAELFKILSDPTKVVSDIDWLSKYSVMISFKEQEEFVTTHEASNTLLSLWTTSAARCCLFKYLDIINTTPGCQILYLDTDSCCFKCPRGKDPFPDGQFLGDLMNELPHDEIEEFLSSGAKQWAMRLRNKSTNKISYSLKIRGITLNSEVINAIHFDSFKDLILNFDEERSITVNYNSILPDKKGFDFPFLCVDDLEALNNGIIRVNDHDNTYILILLLLLFASWIMIIVYGMYKCCNKNKKKKNNEIGRVAEENTNFINF